jgi:hypothetical protein
MPEQRPGCAIGCGIRRVPIALGSALALWKSGLPRRHNARSSVSALAAANAP